MLCWTLICGDCITRDPIFSAEAGSNVKSPPSQYPLNRVVQTGASDLRLPGGFFLMVDRHLLREFSVDEQEIDLLFTESEELLYEHEAQNLRHQSTPEWAVSCVSMTKKSSLTLGTRAKESSNAMSGMSMTNSQSLAKKSKFFLKNSRIPSASFCCPGEKLAGSDSGKTLFPATMKATLSKARSNARSRAACWSTLECTSFLPASQVDVRRPQDIGDYIGQEIECMILKIDEQRRNIVVFSSSADRRSTRKQ